LCEYLSYKARESGEASPNPDVRAASQLGGVCGETESPMLINIWHGNSSEQQKKNFPPPLCLPIAYCCTTAAHFRHGLFNSENGKIK